LPDLSPARRPRQSDSSDTTARPLTSNRAPL
jgi:hypothetical protein